MVAVTVPVKRFDVSLVSLDPTIGSEFMNKTAARPLIRKLDCVRIYVPDLEAGLAFYRDQLGHSLVWRTAEAAGLRLPETDAELVLQTQRNEPEVDMLVDSVEEATQWIVAAGGQVVVPPFDIQIGRCVVVHDPWGNHLVLLDISKGLLTRDNSGNVIGNAASREGDRVSGPEVS